MKRCKIRYTNDADTSDSQNTRYFTEDPKHLFGMFKTLVHYYDIKHICIPREYVTLYIQLCHINVARPKLITGWTLVLYTIHVCGHIYLLERGTTI